MVVSFCESLLWWTLTPCILLSFSITWGTAICPVSSLAWILKDIDLLVCSAFYFLLRQSLLPCSLHAELKTGIPFSFFHSVAVLWSFWLVLFCAVFLSLSLSNGASWLKLFTLGSKSAKGMLCCLSWTFSGHPWFQFVPFGVHFDPVNEVAAAGLFHCKVTLSLF